MQDFKTYIVAIVLIYLWFQNRSGLLLRLDGIRYIPKNKLFGYIYEKRPFACEVCVSFWIGILLTLCTFNILFLTLPLSYKLFKKYYDYIA